MRLIMSHPVVQASAKHTATVSTTHISFLLEWFSNVLSRKRTSIARSKGIVDVKPSSRCQGATNIIRIVAVEVQEA